MKPSKSCMAKLERTNELLERRIDERTRQLDTGSEELVRADKAQDQVSVYLLSAIVDSSDDAIIGKTLDGTITSWNKSAERLFGYTAEEIVGQSVTLLIPPERLKEEPEIMSLRSCLVLRSKNASNRAFTPGDSSFFE